MYIRRCLETGAGPNDSHCGNSRESVLPRDLGGRRGRRSGGTRTPLGTAFGLLTAGAELRWLCPLRATTAVGVISLKGEAKTRFFDSEACFLFLKLHTMH